MEPTLLIAIATMGGLGFLFAGSLAIADKKLRVVENPLIAKVNDVLPGANCGGCGKAGCYDFAVNVVEGKSPVNGCPVGGEETSRAIAEIMGVEAGDSVKMLPRILCRGGNSEAVKKMVNYYGPLSCSAMHLVSGGDKMCYYGCLGGGDCIEACPFDAMFMNADGLPEVIEELCTGCGNCVKACLRDVIEMHPEDRNVFVFCKNHDDPKTSKDVCSVACLGCGICARKSGGGVEMDNYLAVINYDKLDESTIPFDKCRTNAIGHLREINERETIN
ncbi:MAG: RnfABCDGE type electron transport complex subunit B [Melioribacteraceae bacterium]|nr:RnfABCDGE type electron transport complex subunit B [Melioribacteraceae bacterium]MCF8354831.1 RnfABCDGE type electron transport complex subunit B [Melioribacteraceae bacterium]MCF8394538.1 RnfABCDGE type electron transport complex subunit B [Melioribacteraceae bacterium]MCF8420197.1 RnfABCDGE type electron transport complex subunit B [Melioribacteraceae bacterium]